MAEPPPTYTREEMDAILKRAIERQQAKSEEIGHEDLVAAAGEVGIPREEVEAAARDLEAEKARRETGGTPPRSAPQEMNPADEDRARAVRRLYQRAMTFFGLSMFFVFIGHETGTDWWMWAVFGMGISLVIQASRVFFGDPRGDRDEKGRREERRVSRKEQRRMRREERLAEFERKVAIGADALVRVIDEAKNLKTRLETTEREHRAEHGHARAPVRAQDDGPRVLVTPPPGVRVESRESEGVERDADAVPAERARNRRT